MKKLLSIFLVLAGLIVIALAVAILIPGGSSTPVVRTIPSPNGYETLLHASREVVGRPDDAAKMTRDELRLFAAENSNALHTVRVALTQDSLVPWDTTDYYQSNHLNELSHFKTLARTLSAEGRLAEWDGRWLDAAGAYLAMVEMSGLISRGGMVIDALVAIAVESKGLNELRVLAGSITNSADCRVICDKLLELDHDRPRWSSVLGFEEEWRKQAYPGIQFRIASIAMRKKMRAAEQRSEGKYFASQRKLREVTLEFAARAYELDRGNRPATARDLVPGYLKRVPTDPATGQEISLPL